jgi:hypothetical protein
MSSERGAPDDLAAVARAVQEFYERQSYPPPVDSLDGYRDQWRDSSRR